MRSEPKENRTAAGLADIPVKGWIGLAFTIAFMVVAMLAVPALRWFFVLSIAPGLVVAGVLYLINRRREGRNLYVRRDSADDLAVHPGIRIDKIPVKSWVGLVFAVGVMMLFFVALPAVRWFLLLSIPPGIVVGGILYFLHRQRG